MANALTAKELKFCQGKSRSTLRSQRPRLFALYKAHRKNMTVPTNATKPVITGSPNVGHTLETTMGNWNGAPTAYGAQWIRGASTPITGATFAKYLLTSADLGAVHCTITAITGGGQASIDTDPVTVT